MCQKVTCGRCGKATWSGCGQHVEEALRGVPAAQRCTCGSGASTAAPASSGGVFARLFGR